MPRAGRRRPRRVKTLLAGVGLDPTVTAHKFPHELSGGQRQRVNIARALAVQPEVLVADEPTSMLDVSIRLGILELLSRIKRERDLALLYITHDIATAAHVAEEVIVMFAGQMVEWGDTQRVIRDARHPYTRLLLSAVPDPDRPFVAGESANFLRDAEEIRRISRPASEAWTRSGPTISCARSAPQTRPGTTMDLLVKLYALEPNPELDARVAKARRHLFAARWRRNFNIVTEWVGEKFDAGWASETAVAFARQPPSCFVATRAGKVIGFACHDATARGFFGPTGVDEAARGLGVGHALLLACLLDMRMRGYAYGIIGGAGPIEFYAKAVGAVPIEGSEPGIYADLLRAED